MFVPCVSSDGEATFTARNGQSIAEQAYELVSRERGSRLVLCIA